MMHPMRVIVSPHLVHCLLQHRLGIIKPALGHVAHRLTIEEQRGGCMLVTHLLEDVVGILVLVSSLETSKTLERWETLNNIDMIELGNIIEMVNIREMGNIRVMWEIERCEKWKQ